MWSPRRSRLPGQRKVTVTSTCMPLLAWAMIFPVSAEEFTVNSYTTSDQVAPVVAADQSGTFLVVWQDSGGRDGSGSGIFGQRYDVDGAATGDELQINSYTTSNQGQPRIAARPGEFLVTWQGHGAGSSEGLFARRMDNSGQLGPEFLVSAEFDENHDVALDDSGQAVLVWDIDTFNGGIRGQRFDSLNQPVGAQFQIDSPPNTPGYRHQYSNPRTASKPNGEFIVSWESYYEVPYGSFSSRQLRLRPHDASGIPSNDFVVTNFTVTYDYFTIHGFDVTTDGEDFVVAWGDPADYGVQQILSRRLGDSLSAAFEVGPAAPMTFPLDEDPAVDAAGPVTVTAWTSNRFTDDADIGGREFRHGQEDSPATMQLNQETTGLQQSPSIAIDRESRRSLAVWQDPSRGDQDIVGRLLFGTLFADGFESGDVLAWSSSSPPP